MLDRARDRLLAPGDPGLADPGDPLVRIHGDEEEIARAAPDGVRLHVGNLHGSPHSSVSTNAPAAGDTDYMRFPHRY